MSVRAKEQLRDRILEMLGEAIASLRASAEATRKGATHEESRPENDKDTRGLEASYLARGQAARVEAMEDDQKRLRFLALRSFGPKDAIDLTALVTVEVDEREQRFFLVPCSGGLEIDDGRGPIRLLTPASPVGRALVGKRVDDEIELRLAGRTRAYVVLQIE